MNSSAVVAIVHIDADSNNRVSTSLTSSKGTETTDDNSVSTNYNQSENDTSSKGTGTENGSPKFTVEQELLFSKTI